MITICHLVQGRENTFCLKFFSAESTTGVCSTTSHTSVGRNPKLALRALPLLSTFPSPPFPSLPLSSSLLSSFSSPV